MTATKTPAQRGKANQNKGKAAERHLATYLRDWWPEARRAVVTGTSVRGGDGLVREQPDPGDIASVPFIVSVKDSAADTIEQWLRELDEMAALSGEDIALRYLVVKRRGTSPGRWWCWQWSTQAASLTGGRTTVVYPVRVEVRHQVAELVQAGYGQVVPKIDAWLLGAS